MATVTTSPTPAEAAPSRPLVPPPTPTRIGPRDSGRRMTLDEFIAAEWEGGFLYELAQGIVVVTEVPGINHGRIVNRTTELFILYDFNYRGRITYRAGGGECRIRLPGIASDRHPDQAVYLTPAPRGKRPWQRWVPAIVVEVVSLRGEERDYIVKREEYHRFGVLEYWIFDPQIRQLLVLTRNGDLWNERGLDATATYETELLPGLVVSVGEILGPPADDPDDDDELDDEPLADPTP